jgi:hypothetical protein
VNSRPPATTAAPTARVCHNLKPVFSREMWHIESVAPRTLHSRCSNSPLRHASDSW